jgi:hypothetical protein
MCAAFREILVRRELTDVIVPAGPRDFQIIEPAVGSADASGLILAADRAWSRASRE